jgi:PmbA protein
MAVDGARRGGADEAEAFAASGRGLNVELQKNDIHIAKSASADGLGIRVFKDRKLGFAYANSLDEGSVRESVERALAIAAASPRDESNGLPDPVPLAALDGLYDPAVEAIGVGEVVEQALSMLRAARGFDPRVSVDGGGLAAQHGVKAAVSSRGVRAEERGSSLHCVIMGMAKDGDVISSFDFQFEGSRLATGIDPVAVARRFAENVVGSLGAVKGATFRGPVILAPKSAAEIVSYPVEYAVRASSVQKETSKFRGRLGETVASELLTVADDSRLPDGFASSSFDREGLAPQVLSLIEGGVLRHFLYDGYTARKEGRRSTGHAAGGAGSVPSIGTTNVVWRSGDTALEAMIAGVDRGILVTRFSGNVDPVSGDFSGAVKGGRMIRAGRLAEPLCGTMIAGNTFELLHAVSAVSRESEKLFGTVMPYLRMDDVAVTSA